MSCCVLEDASPIATEGRRAVERIRQEPLSIWWQRRKVHLRSGDTECDTAEVCASPFPRHWSQTRGGMQIGVPAPDLKSSDTDTDASSIFSTASQERKRAKAQQQQWDANGYCRHHPRIRLAVKNRQRQVKSSRLKRMFKAGKSNGENDWTVVLPRCPDCREEAELNKLRSNQNSSPVLVIPPSQNVEYVPVPATLNITRTHARLPEDTLAIQVKSAPMPRGQVFPEGDWCWDAPSSGALDFLVPVDAEGNELAAITSISDGLDDVNANEYEYIVERIIPIYIIDHVSRGGDAWDILRNSTGANDLGCKCDVKIHGSAGRLLRFDLNRNRHTLIENEKYSTESVIQMLSSIILWELEVRGSSASGWSSYLRHLFDELCGYGVHEDDPLSTSAHS